MHSLVQLYGESRDDSCGYCKDRTQNRTSWYTSANPLFVNDYQILLNRGWRRCGTMVYKPNNKKTCCPAYTIRCDTKRFKISKSQRRILEVIAKYLKHGKKPETLKKFKPIPNNICNGDNKLCDSRVQPKLPKIIQPRAFGDSGPSIISGRSGSSKKRRWKALQDRIASRAEKLGVSLDECMKEYQSRRQRRLDKNKPKELEEYLDLVELKEKAMHFLDIRLCRSAPRSPEFDSTFEEEFQLYSSYQTIVHKENADSITRDSFIRFLVKSPLLSTHDVAISGTGAPPFGSYHQQYWLDGKKLIAVGVIDLLPGCLSSVYLFYDPEFAFLHLGTYSALREIAFVRKLHRTYGTQVPAYADFTQYYMGYYIHSSVKMRYKAQFSPSYLACPVTFQWVPIKECLSILDGKKYGRFAEGPQNPRQWEDPDPAGVVILLPYSKALASLFPDGRFVIEDDHIITTFDVAARILMPRAVNMVREWLCLVGCTGTMRLDCSNKIQLPLHTLRS